MDWLSGQAQESGGTVIVNLDETSIPLAFGGARGYADARPAGSSAFSAIPQGKKRGAITHICMVTHRSDLQPYLPQIYVGNHRIFTSALERHIISTSPANCIFLRRKSGWATHDIIIQVLQLLADALKVHTSQQIVLLWDCASVHISKDICAAANNLNIWLCYVPARLTALVQPLDAAVFSAYKAILRNAYRDVQCRRGLLSAEDWVNILYLGAKFLRSRRWSRAFEMVGIFGDQTKLGAQLQHLDLVRSCPSLPPRHPPSAVELRGLFPANCKVPYKELVQKPSKGAKRLILA